MVSRWALRDSGLSPTETLVLLALIGRAGHEDRDHQAAGTCYPGQKRLAKDTRLGRRTIVRTVASLVEKGIIRILGGGTGERLVYDLRQTGAPEDHAPVPQMRTPVPEDHKGGVPEDHRGCARGSQGVCQSGVGGVPEDHTKRTSKGTKKENMKRSKPARPRGSRVPEDWKPSEATVLWCRKHGLKPEEISPAAEKFIDFWTARVPDGKEIKTAKGWQAAFKNRIRGSKWVDHHPSYREKEVEILAPKARPAGSKQQNSGAGLEMLKRVARGEISYEQLPAAMQPAHIRAATEREIERLRGEMGDQQQLAIGGAR
jgi:hypothetical protein